MTMLSDGMLLGAAPQGLQFVSASQEDYTTSSASIVVDAPAGVQAGDIIICVLSIAHSSTITISSRPSGFSNVVGRSNADGNNAFVEIKTAGGSEPSTYTWTLSTASTARRASILIYRGGIGLDVSMASWAGPTETNELTQSTTSITATQAGALISIFLARAGSRTISSGPAGMTSRSPQPPAIAVYDLIPSPAGATGAKSVTWSSTSLLMAFQLQIY